MEDLLLAFYNKIVIVGLPGSGKTHLVDMLDLSNDRTVIHTDDFILRNSFEQTLYDMYPSVLAAPRHIVEGVQGFRLLRKGMQKIPKYNYQADLVIMAHCSKETRLERYRKREGKEYDPSLDPVLGKVWNDYITLVSLSDLPKPRIVYWNTETGEIKDHEWYERTN